MSRCFKQAQAATHILLRSLLGRSNVGRRVTEDFRAQGAAKQTDKLVRRQGKLCVKVHSEIVLHRRDHRRHELEE